MFSETSIRGIGFFVKYFKPFVPKYPRYRRRPAAIGGTTRLIHA